MEIFFHILSLLCPSLTITQWRRKCPHFTDCKDPKSLKWLVQEYAVSWWSVMTSLPSFLPANQASFLLSFFPSKKLPSVPFHSLPFSSLLPFFLFKYEVGIYFFLIKVAQYFVSKDVRLSKYCIWLLFSFLLYLLFSFLSYIVKFIIIFYTWLSFQIPGTFSSVCLLIGEMEFSLRGNHY